MTEDKVKRLLKNILKAEQDDADCDECYEDLDRFAELYHTGMDPSAILPRVEAHLNRCGDCHEQYEALLAFLRAEAGAGDA